MKTFNELRDQYLRDNPPPKNLSSFLDVGKYTRAEFLECLKLEGYKISERTLSYYITKGLISKPTCGAKKIGRGKASYFHEKEFQKVIEIRKLQASGHTLEEIKKIISYDDKKIESENEKKNFNYFIALSKVFLENLPKEGSDIDMLKYIGVEPEASSDVCKKYEAMIRPLLEMASGLEDDKKTALEVLKEAGIKNGEEKFNDLYNNELINQLESLYIKATADISARKFYFTIFHFGSDRYAVFECHLFAYVNTLEIVRILFLSDR